MLETGYLTEIFSSIQGEGICIGQRHTFLRFSGCNIRCAGCDTIAALEARPAKCLYFPHGSNHPHYLHNPANIRRLVYCCRQLGNRNVVLTGGEPLFQPEFAANVMNTLRRKGFSTYLETNGALPDAYPMVSGLADVVAMDIKLPSFTGFEPMWETHARFLQSARNDNVFVKVVVTSQTTPEEVATASKLVAIQGREIPMVLQPAGGLGEVLIEHVMRLQDAALQVWHDVRVIPQIHKLMGIK